MKLLEFLFVTAMEIFNAARNTVCWNESTYWVTVRDALSKDDIQEYNQAVRDEMKLC